MKKSKKYNILAFYNAIKTISSIRKMYKFNFEFILLLLNSFSSFEV